MGGSSDGYIIDVNIVPSVCSIAHEPDIHVGRESIVLLKNADIDIVELVVIKMNPAGEICNSMPGFPVKILNLESLVGFHADCYEIE